MTFQPIPVQLDHDSHWMKTIPTIISSADNLFVTAEIAEVNGRLSSQRAFQLAEIIQQVSTIQANGYNLDIKNPHSLESLQHQSPQVLLLQPHSSYRFGHL